LADQIVNLTKTSHNVLQLQTTISFKNKTYFPKPWEAVFSVIFQSFTDFLNARENLSQFRPNAFSSDAKMS